MELISLGIIAIFVAIIGLGIWLSIIIFEDFNKNKSDNPFLLNFDTSTAKGNFFGMVKKREIGAGMRSKITFEPKDVDLEALKEKGEKLQDREIIVGRNQLIVAPKGTLSQDTNVMISLPNRVEDIDSFIKETPLGPALALLCETQNFVAKKEEILKEKIKNRDDLLKEVGDGEMTEELMHKFKGFMMDIIEMQMKSKESNKPAQFNYGNQPSNPSHS